MGQNTTSENQLRHLYGQAIRSLKRGVGIKKIPSLPVKMLLTVIRIFKKPQSAKLQYRVIKRNLQRVLMEINTLRRCKLNAQPYLAQVRVMRRLIYGEGDTLCMARMGFGKHLIFDAYSTTLAKKITIQTVPPSPGEEQLRDIKCLAGNKQCLVNVEQKKHHRKLFQNIREGIYSHSLIDLPLGPEPETVSPVPVEEPLFVEEQPATPTPAEPVPSEAPAVADPSPESANQPVSSEAEFWAAQRADQPRLPWRWDPTGEKNSQPYTPAIAGKWWSRSEDMLSAMSKNQRSDFSHVGRIMETDLGQQLHGDNRCSLCVEKGVECWVYSDIGAKQIKFPGSTCARCRLLKHRKGCSLSTRASKSKRLQGNPPMRIIRHLVPKDGGPPPPEASGI
ncbi:hypothetical protein BDV25DRAFT_147091 [Aspergillus avenaceus]|uniref:Uncharacterized protein n=1 Tax=Aspergillus avenaceus TaxID=36643 RepID=A0A5N6U882_ASPAV|nr:hypothetical protein BDV25DRAFT_147091 [Aspergillus avenaceus]